MEYVDKRCPLPFTTATVYSCLDPGRNVADGGAAYPYTCVNAIAIQGTANSLLALKKLVFEGDIATDQDFKLVWQTTLKVTKAYCARSKIIRNSATTTMNLTGLS